MSLTREDIRHLSRLARLELSEEEYERYSKQLTSVVGYVEQLQKVPTEGIQAVRGVSGMDTILAADILRSADDLCAISTDSLVAGAPLSDGKYLEVRAVLDEGDAS
jgi:aspartyl-tRNA(Asn)/glutamyl-tRNA(Gln) amidotransferase subunit C